MINGFLKREEGKFFAWFFMFWRLKKIGWDDFRQKIVACHQQRMYVSDDEGIFVPSMIENFTQNQRSLLKPKQRKNSRELDDAHCIPIFSRTFKREILINWLEKIAAPIFSARSQSNYSVFPLLSALAKRQNLKFNLYIVLYALGQII